MSLHGGHTPLGKTLNEVGRRTSTSEMRKTRPPRYGGKLKKIFSTRGEDQYMVILTFINPVNGKLETTPPLPLIDPPSTLATLFGSPEDLLTSDIEYMIEYTGPSYKSGRVRPMRSNRHTDINQSAEWNQLDIQGAAFAGPGSGFPV